MKTGADVLWCNISVLLRLIPVKADSKHADWEFLGSFYLSGDSLWRVTSNLMREMPETLQGLNAILSKYCEFAGILLVN